MRFVVCVFVLYSLAEVYCQFVPLRFSSFLDRDKKYELKWDYNDTHMDFEVKVRALGYVGFGISKYGRMTPADFVIGWIMQDQLYFGDYHTEAGSRAPIIDRSTDWLIQGGSESEGFTTLRFTRKLETCDPDDEPITSDTMQIIYSYHDVDPNVTSGLVHYHGASRRGSKYILLMEKNREHVLDTNNTYFTIDFTNYQFPIPPLGSYRQCIVLNMTGYFKPSHVIKYEPIITKGNERFVYRIMLYRCNLTDPVEDGRRYECEKDAPLEIKSCKSIVAQWAMGGKAVSFPEDIGLPLGPDEPSIFVLEIHYTNFEQISGKNDSSGIRLTYTPTLRKFEAGLLELGTVISKGWKEIVPQGEEKYITKAYCSPRCMNWGFQNKTEALKIVGVLFQGNDITSSVKLRHFRGAIELPWITKDNAFSNFHQDTRFLQKPKDVLQWDALVLECQYNSTLRQAITMGGWSRIEEICRATIIYYPRKSFDMCLGWSSLDTLKSETGEPVPGDEAVAYLAKTPKWDRDTKDRVRSALKTSTERTLCAATDRKPVYAVDRYTKPKGEKIYVPNPSSCFTTLIPPLK